VNRLLLCSRGPRRCVQLVQKCKIGGDKFAALAVVVEAQLGDFVLSCMENALVPGLLSKGVNRDAGNLAGGELFGSTASDPLDIDMVITPMVFFGCAYYPWSVLNNFPILQEIVLINPLVCASEGLRAMLLPQFPHLSIGVVLIALLVFNVLRLVLGLRQFARKAVT